MVFQTADCAVRQTGGADGTDVLIEPDLGVAGRGASPRSSMYPTERYINTLGTLSAMAVKSSEALAEVLGTGVRPGIGSSCI